MRVVNGTTMAATIVTDSTTTWRGTTTRTFDSAGITVSSWPVLRTPYARLAAGMYRPIDLGLTGFDALRYVHIGDCYKNQPGPIAVLLGRKPDGFEWSTSTLAHAHRDRICIRDGRYVLAASGQADHVLWHEYAHILEWDDGHGPRWQARMRSFGQIPSRWCPYVYGEPETLEPAA